MSIIQSILASLGMQSAVAANDPYFPYSNLLINADTEIGYQRVYSNNVFADTSLNNATITATGTPIQGSFSPFSITTEYDQTINGGSVYFNGSTDCLTAPTNAIYQFAANFTFETFAYFTSNAIVGCLLDTRSASGNATGLVVRCLTNGNLEISSGAGVLIAGSSNSNVPLNVFTHIALTRVGTVLTLYINGVTKASATVSNTFSDGALKVGCDFGGTQWFAGYLASTRIVSSSAVYTTDFTPATVALTSIPNTSLLLNGVNSGIVDSSGKNNVLCLSTAKITPNVIKYDTGSLVLNGTSDYLAMADSSKINVSNGDFTIECWFNSTTIAVGTAAILSRTLAQAANYGTFAICRKDDKVAVWIGSNGTSWDIANYIPFGTITANTWNHIAIVRSGNTFTAYLNGVGTVIATSSAALYDTNTPMLIGAVRATFILNFFSGYIKDVRIATDVVRYGGNFTPPLSLPKSISTDPYFNNNVLLLKFNPQSIPRTFNNNNTYLDNSVNNNVIGKVGAPVQSAVSPLLTNWNGVFPGTANLTTAVSSELSLGSSNFTIEFWMNPNNGNTNSAGVFRSDLGSSTYSGILMSYNATAAEWQWSASSNGTSWDIANGLTVISAASALEKWNHIALIRNGSTFTVFVNGVSVSTVTNANAINQTSNQFILGSLQAAALYFKGYISNFRVIKGTALYTNGFNIPTDILTAVAGTSLLVLQDNRFVDRSTNNLSLTPSGNPYVQNNGPFTLSSILDQTVSGGSAYFNTSTSDALTTSLPAFGTGDFTIETFVCFNAVTGAQVLFDFRATGVAVQPVISIPTGNNKIGFNCNNTFQITGTTVIIPNVWYHVAVVRISGVTKLYVNGVQEGVSYTDTNNYTATANRPYLGSGSYLAGSGNMNGLLSNTRIVIGTGVYTGNFTPPSSLLQPVNNTALLLTYANAAVVDKTGKHSIWLRGSTVTQPTTVKYGSGAFKLNGSTDYIVMLPTSDLKFGSNDFTIEMWANQSVRAQNNPALFGNYNFSAPVAGCIGLFAGIAANNTNRYQVCIGSNTATIQSTTAVDTNNWKHLAVVRSGDSVKLYVNGVQEGVTANVAGMTFNGDGNSLMIGLCYQASTAFAGELDDIRIANGTAVYTANFTPPARALSLK